jgi:hypothetical protein
MWVKLYFTVSGSGDAYIEMVGFHFRFSLSVKFAIANVQRGEIFELWF